MAITSRWFGIPSQPVGGERLRSLCPTILAPLTNPTNGLTFPVLEGDVFDPELIMPEPCPLLSRTLPKCSVVRPTETKGVAMAALKFLTDMGLFIGQSAAFFTLMTGLAQDADQAQRA